jgi:hypothetical protein
MTNGYEYQRLRRPTGDIRLLRLLPSKSNGNLNDIPACQIFRASLHDDRKFAALSYRWGDTEDSRIILLQNCPVSVTRNLYDAIMALRALEGPVIVWIDFLCIDQGNEIEREQQVQLMSTIYKHAWRVIGWLGDRNDDSYLAFNLFILLGHLSGEHNHQTDLEWQSAADALMETGHMQDVEDLFNPNRRPVQAAASLVQRA